jgi:hypothetical protein
MLSLQTQPKYIKRAVQLPNGSWALGVFELIEVNGKIFTKTVCIKILDESSVHSEETIALPIYFESENITPVVSPFFSKVENILKDLAFITCQPTRAPSFL